MWKMANALFQGLGWFDNPRTYDLTFDKVFPFYTTARLTPVYRQPYMLICDQVWTQVLDTIILITTTWVGLGRVGSMTPYIMEVGNSTRFLLLFIRAVSICIDSLVYPCWPVFLERIMYIRNFHVQVIYNEVAILDIGHDAWCSDCFFFF